MVFKSYGGSSAILEPTVKVWMGEGVLASRHI